MYSINPLPMFTIITPDEVNRFTYGGSLDPNILTSAIFSAEQRFLLPILGSSFYQQLCTQKNIVVASGNIAALQVYFTDRNITLSVGDIVNSPELATFSLANGQLWNNVLWPLIAECVMFQAFPKNYAKFTTSGIIKNNPNPAFLDAKPQGDSAGIGLNDLKYLRDNILLQNINVMIESLERYLCANQSSYPLVPTHIYDKWTPQGTKQESRRSGFVFIYDDDDCGCNNRNNHYTPPAPVPAPAPTPQTRACTLILKVVAAPDPNHVFLMCNLQTIALEYPEGATLTVPHLVGLIVNTVIQIDNAMPFVCPYDPTTGTFDNTLGGGFVDGNTVVINYNEIV